MDKAQFAKISGGFIEALELIKQKRRVYSGGMEYVIDVNDVLYYVGDNEIHESELPFNVLIDREWYIKKPFDVRQAMRDKPDEWVAAFKTSENDWVKVGFDTSEFTVVGLELSNDAPVNATHDYFKVCVYGTDLDACIPLDEVPADAR